ncbi:MAG: hypothetical protein AAF570_09540, partial [Bacteroidota bacterium]
IPEFKPKARTSDVFSKYTRVLRIDLNEKANLPLYESPHPADLYARALRGKDGQASTWQPTADFRRGIVFALLNAMRIGNLQAYSAEDFATPLHYGDLLDFIARKDSNAELEMESSGSWWSPTADALMGLETQIELIVDEIFDRGSGRKRQEVRWLRLLWMDPEGLVPDYNMAVLPGPEALELLDQIPAYNPHNDASRKSLRDLLIARQYEALEVWHSGRNMRGPKASQQVREITREAENYRWEQ